MALEPTPHSKAPAVPETAGDPSMEDILASIRRILNEDETAAPGRPTPEAGAGPTAGHPHESLPGDVLVLDDSMLVPEPPVAPEPALETPKAPEPVLAPVLGPVLAPAPVSFDPPAVASGLMTAATETAAANSVGSLLRMLTAERATQVHRGGPTIEDLVREEVRPLLSAWLDTHLPPMVERLVCAEIERVMGRAAP